MMMVVMVVGITRTLLTVVARGLRGTTVILGMACSRVRTIIGKFTVDTDFLVTWVPERAHPLPDENAEHQEIHENLPHAG